MLTRKGFLFLETKQILFRIAIVGYGDTDPPKQSTCVGQS